MKCEGLDAGAAGDRRSVPPSTMSLLGLVRHLAKVEHHWFRRVLRGPGGPPAASTAPRRTPTSTSTARSAEPQCVDGRLRTSWRREVRRTPGEVYERYDDLGRRSTSTATRYEVRDVVVHMIEEYARHAGHADLLRECIDGRTGQ